MRHLVIRGMIALVCLIGPITAQASANDAHHPEKKSLKSKKPVSKAPKQQKTPATKNGKSNRDRPVR